MPAGLDVHLIVDNHATHKAALIRNCSPNGLASISISCRPALLWLNLVERWFGLLSTYFRYGTPGTRKFDRTKSYGISPSFMKKPSFFIAGQSSTEKRMVSSLWVLSW